MPHRSNDRGSLVVDKRYPELGRLKRATGTTDPTIYKLYVAMLDTLYASGRLDILRALKDRRVTFAEVWEVYRPMKDRPADLNRLPSVETVRKLFVVEAPAGVDPLTLVGTRDDDGAFSLWLRGLDCGDFHRNAVAVHARQLARVAPSLLGATVADVPTLVQKCRARALAARPQRRRMFNGVRTSAITFLKAMVGRAHPLYGAALEVERLKETRKKGRPMEPAEARALRDALNAVTPGAGDAVWAMCCTGMGPKEYWQTPWTVTVDRVRIHGTKREGRVRDVPLVDAAAVAGGPRSAQKTVIHRLYQISHGAQASGGTRRGVRRPSPFPTAWPVAHTAYDGRRTFSHWMAEAGIERARRISYMGHGSVDMTDLYERHQVETHLRRDAEKLRRYLGLDGAPGLTLVKPETSA
jgi:integrase